MTDRDFTVELEPLENGSFHIRVEGGAEYTASDPVKMLAAAIGGCLSASLAHCIRKSRVDAGPVKARVSARIARSDRGRLRVAGVEVELDPGIAEADRAKAQRCFGLFEDYCTVSQSIREGFPIGVSVKGFEQA